LSYSPVFMRDGRFEAASESGYELPN